MLHHVQSPALRLVCCASWYVDHGMGAVSVSSAGFQAELKAAAVQLDACRRDQGTAKCRRRQATCWHGTGWTGKSSVLCGKDCSGAAKRGTKTNSTRCVLHSCIEFRFTSASSVTHPAQVETPARTPLVVPEQPLQALLQTLGAGAAAAALCCAPWHCHRSTPCGWHNSSA